MAQPRIPQIEDYESLVGAETVERIREKARALKGLRVANFNSTYYGGGVVRVSISPRVPRKMSFILKTSCSSQSQKPMQHFGQLGTCCPTKFLL